MELTIEQSRKLKATSVILAAGTLLGLAYSILAHGVEDLARLLVGVTIGIMIAMSVAFFEFVLFSGKIRKIPFLNLLLLRVVSYFMVTLGIILFVLIVYRMFKFGISFHAVIVSEEFNQYIRSQDFTIANAYSLALITAVNFTMQMNRKMGPGVIPGFITGKYYQPKNVNIIIMFLKIRHGKKLIDSYGRLHFHRYINDLIFEITDIIINRKGEIYEYVDEEIVLIWKSDTGFENANCVRTYFELKDKASSRKAYFYEKYHVIPEFFASLHCGKVIRGEIGELKSAIKYHGDAMNTASRILGLTTEANDFLASSDILQKLTMPIIYDAASFGKFDLKGKVNKIELFTIREKEIT